MREFCRKVVDWELGEPLRCGLGGGGWGGGGRRGGGCMDV